MAENPDAPLLIDVKTAAPRLGISPRRLYALASMPGALPEGLVIRLGRSVFLSRPRLMAWLVLRDGRETAAR